VGIDVVILSRGRERELSTTLNRLASTDLQIVVMHNNPTRIPARFLADNITYVFCPGENFGIRAARATEYLKSEFCVISADDDGLIECELFRMEKFLRENENFSSVGGIAIGAFPYAKFVAGAIAYREMLGYRNSYTDRIERIKNHLTPPGSSNLPRTALYRLSRRELTVKLLEALGESSKVGTPYIYEVTAEIVSAWAGNTIYINCPYWIRNWKNQMISNGDWNRQYGFDSWWKDFGRDKERDHYVEFLSSFLDLDKQFMIDLLDDYASTWGKVFRVPNEQRSRVNWKFGRSSLQAISNNLRPSNSPTSIEELLSTEFPNLTSESRIEIWEVTQDMFFNTKKSN